MLLEYDAGGTTSFSPQLKLVPGQQRSQVPEIPGKGARGNHLQKPDRAIARVPEGVKDPAPLENRLSRPRGFNPVALLYCKLSFQHVGDLVLSAVPVERRAQMPGAEHMLNHRDCTAGCLTGHFIDGAEASDPDRFGLCDISHTDSR